MINEIDLTDPAALSDPFATYGQARERSPVVRLRAPGMSPMWAVTRHAQARAMLTDPRFALSSGSFALRPEVPEDCKPYMRTMGEMEGPEHTRLRKLVAPAFTARRAAAFRPRIEPIVDHLLDDLAGQAERGSADVLAHLARPLPMEAICELVGISEADRPRWRECGAAIAAGAGADFAAAIPGIIGGAKAVIAARRAEPRDDLVSDLIRAQDEDGDRLGDAELVTLVWHLVLAGQTPTNLITNAVHALLTHPDQLAALRADPDLMPRAVEELMRWCGPALLAVPRHAVQDVEFGGARIAEGDMVTVAIVAANRDPRAFPDPDTLDLARTTGSSGHLGFAHGPHFCLGASLARVQTQAALAGLLRRFPDLALAAPEDVRRVPDGGTWRLASLPVTL